MKAVGNLTGSPVVPTPSSDVVPTAVTIAVRVLATKGRSPTEHRHCYTDALHIVIQEAGAMSCSGP